MMSAHKLRSLCYITSADEIASGLCHGRLTLRQTSFHLKSF